MTYSRNTIRINDLRRPVLTDAARRLLADADRNPVRLSVDKALEAAQRATNLDTFGPDDFRERLRRWLQAAADDPNMTTFGRNSVFFSCVRLVSTRLRLHDLLSRHPEIHDVQILSPIIVVGPPRSGTTHLQGLLAADSRLRSLRLWEAIDPIYTSSRVEASEDSRLKLYSSRQGSNDEPLPYAMVMDPNRANDMAEDLLLQLPDFPTGLDQAGAPISQTHSYLEHDQTQHYEYMKTMLKALQWLRGPDRWILKSPDHCEQLRPLLKTFPDAVVIMTHRDPVAIIQSIAVMKAYGARLSYRKVDIDAIFGSWVERIKNMLRCLLRDRYLVDSSKLIDVPFGDIASGSIDAVERIHAVTGLHLTKDERGRMLDFLADYDRESLTRIAFDIRGDFGAEPSEMRTRFSFYCEQFPVKNEVH